MRSGRVRPAYLYHGTTPDSAERILYENVIKGKTSHPVINHDGIRLLGKGTDAYKNGVSFTRSPYFARKWTSGEGIVFVLNRSEILTKHKLYPVNVYDNEYEEFLLGDLKNLNKYLVQIQVSQETYDELKNINDVYPNDTDKPYFYLLTHPLLSIIGKKWHTTLGNVVTESHNNITRHILKDGTVEYRDENGELHREGRPARIMYYRSEWYSHGVKYMDKDQSGRVRYFDANGRIHREDKPAIEDEYGTKFWFKHGELHREDGPAIEYSDGTKEWYQNGLRHNDNGPAVEWINGTKKWYQNGHLHRKDGPAIEYSHGDKEWYQNDKLHREDGPAIEYSDGSKEWWQNNKRHRLDGPAVEYPNGDKQYWIYGRNYTELQFKKEAQLLLTESVTKNTYMTKQGRVIEYRDENGELHHDTRAALIDPEGFHFYNHGVKYKKIDPKGNVFWYNKDGEFHREDGPAFEKPNGTKKWYRNGQFHRIDGPAVEYPDGYKSWWQNDRLHREDGPAVEYADGSKEWWQNGKRHRLDGPAIDWSSGNKEYWIDNKRYSELQFKEKTQNLTESVTKNTYMTKKGRVIEYRDENGELHHDTRAALIDPNGFHFYNHGVLYKRVDPNGDIFWYNKDGQLHRDDGPAVERASGTKIWYQNGLRHRDEKPAIEWASGTKVWYKNGLRHREDGPAVERANGDREWYENGHRHRLDGPAVECSDGDYYYWIYDKEYTEKEFKEKTQNLTESVTKNVRITKKGRVIEYRDENGELHHDTRAALINPDGFHFYNHGVKYKTINPDGVIYWYDKDGQFHRADGPAVEWPNRYEIWFKHGKRHRLDGPAVIYPNGTMSYWINNVRYTEAEWEKRRGT